MPFFGNLSTIEWIIIASIVILLFGGARLKSLARGLGESGKELKRVRHEFKGALEDEKLEVPDEEATDEEASERGAETKGKKR